MRALAPRPTSRSSTRRCARRRQEGAYRDTANLARALVLPDPTAVEASGLVAPRRAPRLATLQARLQELRGAQP